MLQLLLRKVLEVCQEAAIYLRSTVITCASHLGRSTSSLSNLRLPCRVAGIMLKRRQPFYDYTFILVSVYSKVGPARESVIGSSESKTKWTHSKRDQGRIHVASRCSHISTVFRQYPCREHDKAHTLYTPVGLDRSKSHLSRRNKPLLRMIFRMTLCFPN